MSIAITEDHRALAATVSDFLAKHASRTAARGLLEADDEPNASFYKEAADLGWLGLHVPEEHGGSGYGLTETVVIVEELGRALAPGAFVPTLIASAVLVAAAGDDVKGRTLRVSPTARCSPPLPWAGRSPPAAARSPVRPGRCWAPASPM